MPPMRKKLKTTTPKSSRAYKKSYSSGPPLVPQYIFEKIWAYVDRIKLRKKQAILETICKYWSLKREARRGAPLLKRLHLEVCP
jgi:NuA3 HAT complex component NTO1